MPQTAPAYSYDVCLSFAGEDRKYVKQVASLLQNAGLDVFYDEFEEENLWGRDLYEHLDYIYSKASRLCIVFCSKNYANKLWTSHERRSAQERAFRDNTPYILPARFDDTEVPGIRGTTGYIDLRETSPKKLTELVRKKIGNKKLIEINQREKFLPPERDLLFQALGVKTEEGKSAVQIISSSFFQSLSYMTQSERFVLFPIFQCGCPHDLPKNIHISFDLLQRITGLPAKEVRSRLERLSSIGFQTRFPKRESDCVYVTWISRSPDKMVMSTHKAHTGIADMMIKLVSRNYCSEHGMEMLMKLNFSALSAATYVPC